MEFLCQLQGNKAGLGAIFKLALMFLCFVPFEWSENQSHKPKLQNYLEFRESFSIWDSTMEPIKFLLDFLCCRFSTSFFFPSLSLQTSWPWVGTPPSPWLEITYYRWGQSFLQNKSHFFVFCSPNTIESLLSKQLFKLNCVFSAGAGLPGNTEDQ